MTSATVRGTLIIGQAMAHRFASELNMIFVLILIGSALAVAIAIVLWRLTGPGKCLRFGALTLYYTRAVRAAEAERLGEYLERQKFTNMSMTARLTREAATYQLQVIYLGQPDQNETAAWEVLAAGLSDDLFGGAAVAVQICDNIFRPTSVIPHRGRFGRRLAMNAAHLFFLEGVTDSQAFEVATFLAGVGVFDDSPKIAQMNRNAERYEFRLDVVVDPLTPEMLEGARQMASDLSQVLGGAPVAVNFCKGLLGTLRAARAEERSAADSHVAGGPYRTEVYSLPGPLLDGNDVRDEERGDR